MDPLERSEHITERAAPAPVDPVPSVDQEPTTLGAWLAYNGPVLGMMLAVVLAVLYVKGIDKGLDALRVGILLILGLGFVIFIHELGHFLTAKWCDVYVETFSIGFGPALPGCRFQKGETTYMIALFPLGGYVKMLGEGENDEDDTNPRSFKNKPVWQRMIIISAGVVMNVILGAVCFIFVYMAHGERQLVGAIGAVESGSPAWVKGAKSSDVIYRIGKYENPSFNDLKAAVPLAGAGPLPFAFGPPGGKDIVQTTIEPRRSKDDSYPVIGIAPSSSLKLFAGDPNLERKGPYYYNSAASRAEPPFAFGDEVIAMTDPAHPSQVTELPKNPYNPQSTGRDYFEFRRRLQQLAGQEVKVVVQRKADPNAPKTDEPPVMKSQEITLPPQFHHTLGLRMTMGRVVAVRQLDGAPASPIQYQNQEVDGQKVEGDTIHAVEVAEVGGVRTRWVVDRSNWRDQAIAQILTGVVEQDLDPVRLPYELRQWATRTPAPRQVQLTIKRKVQTDPNYKKTFTLPWDDGFRFDNEVSMNLSAPIALPELGIAYHVETTVKAVLPNSPAARAVGTDGQPAPLKEQDVIKSIWRFQTKPDGTLGEVAKKPVDLKQHQWAFAEYSIQFEGAEHKQFKLLVERGKDTFEVVLQAEEERGWPTIDRGLVFEADQHIKKAQNIGEAVQMGTTKTVNFIKMVYQMLQGIVTGRLAVDNIGGPLMIAHTGYKILEYDIFDFILFLGMISVNLAVVNFLPIPVLDGGHFVFLVYEGLRGKPASKKVLIATTWIGLCLIVSLMLFVIFMDVHRYFLS
ncbi:MAG: site-2 protease family protein [Planctomycetia bacterium]|nr:site-2 protease family protein [Planctomycetia bacterium]